MMMKITFWSDYTCPWCWIGEARLKKAAAELLTEIGETEYEMKAFQLNPYAPLHAKEITRDRLIHDDGLSPEQADARVLTVNETAKSDGLPFNYGTSLATNTMGAHRLTKLAHSKNDPILYSKVINSLFKAYFTDNKELADHTLLQQIGEEAGLPADEIRTLLESDRFQNEVLSDEKEADYYGIHSVPFFVIGRYGVSGAQSPEYFKAVLRQVKQENESEINGNSCGPNGC